MKFPVMQTRAPMDRVLISLAIPLVAFGVVMVYGASNVFASRQFHNGHFFLIRQAIYACVGVGLMVAMSRVHYKWFRRATYPLLGTAVFLMLLTAIGLGRRVGGAARWLSLGFISIQPSEMMKFALVLWLAYSLAKKSGQMRSFSIGFLPHVMVATLLIGLCLAQPDFGSAVMVVALTFVLLFTAGARLGYIVGACFLALPVVYGLVATSEYRMRRVRAFLEPFKHRYDIGYQISESLMSFGSGGVTGLGIGESRQKLFFLPEAHNDFIGAIIGEELGFVGVSIVLVIYCVIVYRGLRIAFRANEDYGTYLAVGLTMFVGLHAFTNWAVALGMLPTKGLGMPLISYGGSSLLINCLALGILLSISRVEDVQEAKRNKGAAA